MNKRIAYLILITMLVSLFLQPTIFSKPKTRLNHKKITLKIGQTKQLKIKNKPKKIKVKWTSKNKSIAKVTKKGKVVAKRCGRTIVIAKVRKKKYKCKVTVIKKKEEAPIVLDVPANFKIYNPTALDVETTPPTSIIPETTTTIPSTTTPETTTVIPTTTASETAVQKENRIVTNLSKKINVTCHRGYNRLAPENSIAAFRLAKEYGYNTVETDIRFTKDGVPVILHDSTINRVARNLDGTEITEPIKIADITYEEALAFDFGIYKSREFKGAKILTLDECLPVFKELDINIYLHIIAGTESQIRGVFDEVVGYGLKDHVTWYSFTRWIVACIRDCDHTVRLGLAKSSGITPEIISQVEDLRKYGNPVFLNSCTYSDEEIQLCKDANIPLEAWFFNDLNVINSLDSYISGVTVDYIR